MKKAILWLDKNAEEVLLGAAMVAMFAILLLQTVLRYCFNAALKWPEELSRYVFIWYVFVGMSYCERYHTHLIVDFLTAFFPKIKGVYSIIGDISVLIFSGVMAAAGVSKLQSLMASHQLSPAMEIPMFYCYLALEVGFVLCVIRSVQSLILRALGKYDHMILDGGEEEMK